MLSSNFRAYVAPQETNTIQRYMYVLCIDKLSFSKLNFPNDNTTSSEDDESSDEQSDASRSSSDSCHSGDDDESDEEDAVKPPPSLQARPYFERDPMLDQLFADSQNKTQQEE